jgi:hypothetical protein
VTRDGTPSLRELFDRGELRIGGGEIGGKAAGLVFFNAMLAAEFDASRFPGIETGVPAFAIVGTDCFDELVAGSRLDAAALAGGSDEEIAVAFQAAALPEAVVSGVRDLLAVTDRPLAVRSSSLMEDAIFSPFAGVYETKMLPNNQADPAVRLHKVLSAIKLVHASTFFRAARDYIRATGKAVGDEKMAVVLQEVVGARHGNRFYPLLSGVARSYNFYPTGGAKPEEGVTSLALGLGKTIVDGGVSWTFSPARPQAPPPYGTIGELLDRGQLEYWCVNMAPPAAEDPLAEAEHLVRVGLDAAEQDGLLRLVASTYDAQSDRLVPGTSRVGPRVVNFAPILTRRELPLNAVVRELLVICEAAAGAPVEIEFALAPAGDGTPLPRLGFLQVRPMFVSHDLVEIAEEELSRPELVLASRRAMGNGRVEGLCDVVFVKPEAFEARHTRAIAAEVETVNRALADRRRPYLLIGFGRWGSSDPWLGIPVDWGQIAGAKVIVEATLPAMDVEPSQGAHFFHNILGNGVAYFCVHHAAVPGIDWEWLKAQPVVTETSFLRHVELAAPLEVRVDGRSGRGAVWRQPRA